MKYLIVNASPVILLGKIGRLDMLKMFDRKAMVPLRVVREVNRKKTPEALALKNATSNWLEVFDDVPNASIISSIIGEDVSRGEVDVIAKAQQLIHDGHDVVVVLDDLPARQGAEALSIQVTGTLGVVIHGVRSGFLTSAQGIEIVNSLLSIGARLDPLLVRKVIELISL
jgi:predicted nucleic acid-binding protein